MIHSLMQFIALVWEAFWRALVLDEQLLFAVEAAPRGRASWVVATIVFLAGVAQLLGQSIVLFVNRVQPRRFVWTLLLNGALFLIGLFLWAAVIWLVGRFFGFTPPFILVLRMVGLGSAPLIFSVFVLIPYAGQFLGRIFSVWSFLITVGMLRFTYATDLPTALMIGGAGWLAFVLLNALVGRPIRYLRKRLFRRVAGAALDTSAHDLLATIPGANDYR
jgi:hypothetical protein